MKASEIKPGFTLRGWGVTNVQNAHTDSGQHILLTLKRRTPLRALLTNGEGKKKVRRVWYRYDEDVDVRGGG